jgi:hypothetical protein
VAEGGAGAAISECGLQAGLRLWRSRSQCLSGVQSRFTGTRQRPAIYPLDLQVYLRARQTARRHVPCANVNIVRLQGNLSAIEYRLAELHAELPR